MCERKNMSRNEISGNNTNVLRKIFLDISICMCNNLHYYFKMNICIQRGPQKCTHPSTYKISALIIY
jgi:hypothetical protein